MPCQIRKPPAGTTDFVGIMSISVTLVFKILKPSSLGTGTENLKIENKEHP